MAKPEKTTHVYVCSKMAGDNAYTKYKTGDKAANDLPRKERQVLIKGGAGVTNKQLVTPYGVVTKITSEELDMVMTSCPAFKRQMKAGYLKVLEKDPSEKDIKLMSKDMPKDKSEQATKETVTSKKTK